MSDLKPVAEIVDDPLMVSGLISDVQFLCEEDLAVGTRLYAIPPTHRVVSVADLESMEAQAKQAIMAGSVARQLRAIIDNKE